MASFRCYNNSDVIANLITTNFHLYLIHLWGQLFQMFVCGDVVYAQTWQVLTLKNCMEPFSYASTAYLVASALVSVRLFCKNLGNLQKFFGQMVYRPPWQKIARTPMGIRTLFSLDHKLYTSDYDSDSDSDSVASENQPLRLDETHRFHKARVYCANSYSDMASRCTTCWGERSIRF